MDHRCPPPRDPKRLCSLIHTQPMTKPQRFPDYVFKPRVSFGPITFEMPRDDVRDRMRPYRHSLSALIKLSRKRKSLDGDAYHNDCLHFLYDADQKVSLIVASALSVRKLSARGIDVLFNRPNRVIQSLAKKGWIHHTSAIAREMNAGEPFDAKRPSICIVPDLAIGFLYADFDDYSFQTMFMGPTYESIAPIVAFYTPYT
jgi:hypothetical protein